MSHLNTIVFRLIFQLIFRLIFRLTDGIFFPPKMAIKNTSIVDLLIDWYKANIDSSNKSCMGIQNGWWRFWQLFKSTVHRKLCWSIFLSLSHTYSDHLLIPWTQKPPAHCSRKFVHIIKRIGSTHLRTISSSMKKDAVFLYICVWERDVSSTVI